MTCDLPAESLISRARTFRLISTLSASMRNVISLHSTRPSRTSHSHHLANFLNLAMAMVLLFSSSYTDHPVHSNPKGKTTFNLSSTPITLHTNTTHPYSRDWTHPSWPPFSISNDPTPPSPWHHLPIPLHHHRSPHFPPPALYPPPTVYRNNQTFLPLRHHPP